MFEVTYKLDNGWFCTVETDSPPFALIRFSYGPLTPVHSRFDVGKRMFIDPTPFVPSQEFKDGLAYDIATGFEDF